MLAALLDAGIGVDDVGYINAHGTSTRLNDRLESETISGVFGGAFGGGPGRVRVSSTKSMTGHMIAAAGAVEFAVTLEALRRQVLPPTVNLFELDDKCPVTLTPGRTEAFDYEYALSNSVGFGGSNSALIARRFPS
jgi:3-oxoacyl-[acyl-carrier-protein] synthase II